MARPLKVLLVLSHPVQYATPVIRRYAQESGLEVTVAYSSLRGAEASLDPDFRVAVEWDIPLLDGYRWVHPRDRAGPATRRLLGSWNPGLWDLVRRARFDVVTCYGYRSGSFWIAAVAARASGSKLLWATDAIRLSPRDGGLVSRAKTPLKRVLVPAIFATGHGVIAQSSRTVEFLKGIGVPVSRTFLIPFVIDNSYFERGAAAADLASVRKEWDVPMDGFVALFSGKLVPWKRPQDLLDATARMAGSFAVFAGDGPLRHRLMRRAEQLGITERVRFLGFVNQSALPGTYAAADVLVLPSEFEPFGLVVNEAFASGTPVIASSACGAVGDLVRDNQTGLTYHCGDVATLSAWLVRLAESPELRQRLAEAARTRIRGWSVEENAVAFHRAVREIAG